MEDMDLMPTLAEAAPPAGAQELPSELRQDDTVLQKIQRVDERREGFPGEHWLVLGLGIAVWHFTRKDPRFLVRTAGGFAATALVARAASGRDGLSKVLRWTPLGRGISRCPPCDTAEDARTGR